MTNTRDIGLEGAAGKGDAPRTKLDENYRARYDAIDWKRADVRWTYDEVKPGKWRKIYR